MKTKNRERNRGTIHKKIMKTKNRERNRGTIHKKIMKTKNRGIFGTFGRVRRAVATFELLAALSLTNPVKAENGGWIKSVLGGSTGTEETAPKRKIDSPETKIGKERGGGKTVNEVEKRGEEEEKAKKETKRTGETERREPYAHRKEQATAREEMESGAIVYEFYKEAQTFYGSRMLEKESKEQLETIVSNYSEEFRIAHNALEENGVRSRMAMAHVYNTAFMLSYIGKGAVHIYLTKTIPTLASICEGSPEKFKSAVALIEGRMGEIVDVRKIIGTPGYRAPEGLKKAVESILENIASIPENIEQGVSHLDLLPMLASRNLYPPYNVWIDPRISGLTPITPGMRSYTLFPDIPSPYASIYPYSRAPGLGLGGVGIPTNASSYSGLQFNLPYVGGVWLRTYSYEQAKALKKYLMGGIPNKRYGIAVPVQRIRDVASGRLERELLRAFSLGKNFYPSLRDISGGGGAFAYVKGYGLEHSVGIGNIALQFGKEYVLEINGTEYRMKRNTTYKINGEEFEFKGVEEKGGKTYAVLEDESGSEKRIPARIKAVIRKPEGFIALGGSAANEWKDVVAGIGGQGINLFGNTDVHNAETPIYEKEEDGNKTRERIGFALSANTVLEKIRGLGTGHPYAIVFWHEKETEKTEGNGEVEENEYKRWRMETYVYDPKSDTLVQISGGEDDKTPILNYVAARISMKVVDVLLQTGWEKELGGSFAVAIDLGKYAAVAVEGNTIRDIDGVRKFAQAGFAFEGGKKDFKVIVIPTATKGIGENEGYLSGTVETTAKVNGKRWGMDITLTMGGVRAEEGGTTQVIFKIGGEYKDKDNKEIGLIYQIIPGASLLPAMAMIEKSMEAEDRIKKVVDHAISFYGRTPVGAGIALKWIAGYLYEKGREDGRSPHFYDVLFGLLSIKKKWGITLEGHRYHGIRRVLDEAEILMDALQRNPARSGEIIERLNAISSEVGAIYHSYSIGAYIDRKMDLRFTLVGKEDENGDMNITGYSWYGVARPDGRVVSFIRTSGYFGEYEEMNAGLGSVGAGLNLLNGNWLTEMSGDVILVFDLNRNEQGGIHPENSGWGIIGALTLYDSENKLRERKREVEGKIQKLKREGRKKEAAKMEARARQIEREMERVRRIRMRWRMFASYLKRNGIEKIVIPSEGGYKEQDVSENEITVGTVLEILKRGVIYAIYKKSRGDVFLRNEVISEGNMFYAGAKGTFPFLGNVPMDVQVFASVGIPHRRLVSQEESEDVGAAIGAMLSIPVARIQPNYPIYLRLGTSYSVNRVDPLITIQNSMIGWNPPFNIQGGFAIWVIMGIGYSTLPRVIQQMGAFDNRNDPWR